MRIQLKSPMWMAGTQSSHSSSLPLRVYIRKLIGKNWDLNLRTLIQDVGALYAGPNTLPRKLIFDAYSASDESKNRLSPKSQITRVYAICCIIMEVLLEQAKLVYSDRNVLNKGWHCGVED